MNTIRRTQLWRAGLVIILILATTASAARADKPPETTSPTVTPVPPKKREAQPAALDAGQGNAQFSASPEDPAALLAPLAASAAGAAGGSLISCGASGSSDWTTTSITFQVIRQCTLTLPQAGWVFISANGSLALQDLEYEAWFRLGIDSTTGDYDINRFVNIYDDATNGTDESIALSALRQISAGTHTFYFLGSHYRSDAVGTVRVRDASLSVIFIPALDTQVLACGAPKDTDLNITWTTTSTSFKTIHQCTLTAPQAGWAFISADGSAGLYDTSNQYDYEAQFSIGIDISTTGKIDSDRYVNVYYDGGDGTDKSVALSVLKPVSAGAHTFYSLGRLSDGAGPTYVYDPTLTVIFIPAPDSQVLACGSSGHTDWTTASSTFEVIRQCQLSVPQAGRVFLSADGSSAWQDGAYEAQFSIGIDGTGGDAGINRWVDVYNDAGTRTENSVALSVLKHSITPGTHTFYFLGRISDGTNTLLLRDPTLSVIFSPSASIYVPVIMRGP